MLLDPRGFAMCLHFDPNHEKTTQALNFLAGMNGSEINKMAALKLVFLADRYHLRKHGRSVIGNEYFAMKQGPVASMAKDLADKSTWLDDCEREYADRFLTTSEDKLFLTSVSPVTEDIFSDSDIEALLFVWEAFGTLSEWDLVNRTHAYPEWEKHEGGLAHGNCRRVRMEYADFFLDADPRHPLLSLTGHRDVFGDAVSPEQKAAALEAAEEDARVRSLWARQHDLHSAPSPDRGHAPARGSLLLRRRGAHRHTHRRHTSPLRCPEPQPQDRRSPPPGPLVVADREGATTHSPLPWPAEYQEFTAPISALPLMGTASP